MPLGKLANRAIYFTLQNFFKWTENISSSTGPNFTIFSQYERYLREFSIPHLFFQFLKGRFHANRFWAKFAK